MWFDNLSPDSSWTSLWSGYIRCGTCAGIRTTDDPCPVCGASLPTTGVRMAILEDGLSVVLEDGEEAPLQEHRIVHVQHAYAGGETRYEDYVYLQTLEREWKHRGQTPREQMPFAEQVPAGTAIVLIFWTYFESRIEYLLRAGLQHIPPRFLEDALTRYSTISSRMDRLYRVAFESTYHADLSQLGYSDVSQHLAVVQARRNSFVHGTPQSIDGSLVTSVVEMLKREHEAWIAVYNLRASRPPHGHTPTTTRTC